ncbi:unnamed protein product [Haemonchus placei]|uniref:Peptidase_M14 domain-containing protein n=1 Tax=Haemonchus placei TaxID=6290 RepID=A0A0N4W4I3_HAEPC|nr:unnamed protein product [Haemonchus placei]
MEDYMMIQYSTASRRTARRAINRLHRQYGTEYRMGTGADTLSPASGGSDDWAKSNGIKYVYLVELRPEYELSNGFILHKKELIPTAVETFEGVKEVIEAVLEHNKIVKDPLSRIAPQLRKKQLYRMRLLGLANGQPTMTTTELPTTQTTAEETISGVCVLNERSKDWETIEYDVLEEKDIGRDQPKLLVEKIFEILEGNA